jgi:membrane-associated phospholipid phosphatase
LPTPIDALDGDVLDAFSGTNLIFYGTAVAATGVMAFSGADQAIRVGVQRHMAFAPYGDASVVAGYVVPVVTAPAIYVVGLAVHDRETAGAGSAAVQALAVTFVTTGLLQWGVGRDFPLNGGSPAAPDLLDHPEVAHEFRPFQTFAWPPGAWPSGHTSATISVAAALTAYYPGKPWIPAIGYPLGLAIGFGMVDGDHHWASDVVAGALLGHAIGWSVGRAFRRRLTSGAVETPGGISVLPQLGARSLGVSAVGTW